VNRAVFKMQTHININKICYFLISSIFLLLSACDNSEPEKREPVYHSQVKLDKPNYHFAIHPLHNPTKLAEAYQPLIDYLNTHITAVHFELESSRDYQAFEEKFRKRKPEVILPNPWQTLEAIKVGYRVINMAGDPEDFKGIFIVRKDSGITSPQDLIGKVVSYPSHTALAACMMPQRYLHDNGIDVMKDINNRYVGSQESSIMNALLGDSAAGATWPPPWRLFQRDRPEDAAQLKVIWETPHLMNNSVMVRNDVDSQVANLLTKLLTNLHETKQGQEILKKMSTARFYPAADNSYQPVQDFVNEFEKDVRPVEQK